MLYRVKLYTPMQYERGFEVTNTCIVGTKRAAELQAEAWLPPSNETYYSAKVARLPWVEVYDSTDEDHAPSIKDYHTPINYVPSVGDLGYW